MSQLAVYVQYTVFPKSARVFCETPGASSVLPYPLTPFDI